MHASYDKNTYETTIRSVLDACADCDTCRFLMDESCLFFPELYRLYDQEKEHGCVVSEGDLRRLSERCTLCGLCPCPNIRMDVIRGKTERVRAKGMSFRTRLLADVQRFGQLGMLAPKLLNRAFSFTPICRLVKNAAGIHPHHRLPWFPGESFFDWARRRRLDQRPNQEPKVAYFVGCTAGYLFPEVARAAVAVMERNGISVFVPPQNCCGIPTLLEGDKWTTIRRVRSNLKTLLEAMRVGFDIVSSCPTCGFLTKVLLKERAYYSDAYQHSVGAGADEIKVPKEHCKGSEFISLKKSTYTKILKDDSYFSGFDPLERITLSENIMDVGEYLIRFYQDSGHNPCSGEMRGHMAYFAPCHQREQGIGSPYLDLLNRINGLTVEQVGNEMDCCGMGGSLGFKKDFYDASIRLALPMIQKIQAVKPEAIITDCLSCKLQFQHLLPYPVYHPLEILSRAYEESDFIKGRT